MLIGQDPQQPVDAHLMVWPAYALAIVCFALLTIVWRRGRNDDAQYRAILDGAPSGMVVFDADRLLYANHMAANLVGLEGSEGVIGRTFEEVLAPEVAATARAGCQEILATQQPVSIKDFPMAGRDGAVVRCDLRFIPISYNGRQAVQGSFTRVDDIHQVEAALRETEERFRLFFEELPVPMYRTRVDGTIVNANKALATMLGVDEPSQLAGINASKYYADDSERHRLASLQQDQGVLEDQISELVREDGERVWVRDSSHTIDDAESQIFEGALVDVTKGQRATTELMLRARQQQALAHVGQVALRSIDTGEVLAEAVAQVCNVLGAECAVLAQEHEDHGLLITTAAYATDSTRRREEVLAYVESHISLAKEAAEVVELPPDDRIADGRPGGVAVSITGLSSPYGVLAVGGSDVDLTVDGRSFVVAAAAMLGSAIDRSRARSHLERLIRSKDEFVASVSHELRTPLTVVAGLSLELESRWRGFSSAEIAEFISLIADQSREMSDLIEDLLVAARADIGKVPIHTENEDLHSSAGQVVASCSLADRARVSVVGNGVHAWVDPVRFRQIVRNLVTNAIRYGGPKIQIQIASHDDRAVVAVVDDGAGIPEAQRERIFLAYQRAHSAGGVPSSVGLGLTVSQKLTELMDGTIAYRHEDGCVFEVTFPMAPAPAAGEATVTGDRAARVS